MPEQMKQVEFIQVMMEESAGITALKHLHLRQKPVTLL